MKHKLSITVEEGIVLRVFDALRTRKFRNKSHFFEAAAERLLKESGVQ